MREISENHPRACTETSKDKVHGFARYSELTRVGPLRPELEWKRGKACIVSEIDDTGFFVWRDTDVGI